MRSGSHIPRSLLLALLGGWFVTLALDRLTPRAACPGIPSRPLPRRAVASRETAEKIGDSITRSRLGVELSRKVAPRLDEIVTKARQLDQLAPESASA